MCMEEWVGLLRVREMLTEAVDISADWSPTGDRSPSDHERKKAILDLLEA